MTNTKQNKMAYLINVDWGSIGQMIVIANNISEVDKKIKDMGFYFNYEIEKVIDYVL